MDAFRVGGILTISLVAVALVAMLRLRRPRIRDGSVSDYTADDRLAMIHFHGFVGVLFSGFAGGMYIVIGVPGAGAPGRLVAAGAVLGGGALVAYALVGWELHRHGDRSGLLGRDLATWAWALLPLLASMVPTATGFLAGITAMLG